MIKAIIFDCFGVLTEDAWRAFCRTLPRGEVLAKAKELNRQYDSALITMEQFVEQIHEVTGQKIALVEDSINNPEPHKNLELLSYIEKLKSKYKIGLISNVGTNWIRDYFLSADEQKLFDSMIMSFEVGVTKPEPEIYKMAAEKLGVSPNHCAFVDDIPRYVEAAEAVGMSGVVYDDFDHFKTDLEKILKS